MSNEVYHLNQIESSYKKWQSDKKKTSLKALQLILELNKNVGFDEILIREGFQVYLNKEQLIKNTSLSQCEAFFKYMLDQLDHIQQNYLRQSNQKQIIQKARLQNEKEYNFLLNKNSVSKFIRDEATFYQKIVDSYLQDLGVQQQKGIKSTKIHLLFVELFNNKYISIIKNNQLFLKAANYESLSLQIGICLLNYGIKVKEMTKEQAETQYIINQEEILDFLTFWLKQESGNNLFVLYARTKHRLDQQSKILINKSAVQTKVHPSRMTKAEINQLSIEQQQHLQNILKQAVNQKDQSKDIQKKQPIIINDNGNTIDLTFSKIEEPVLLKQQKVKKQPSKQELLKRQLKDLFEFGCKRKYKLNKYTTFDELENERKTMDLQKFLYFCNFFELTKIISKELVTQYFKLYAINLRTIDFVRFTQIVNKMIMADSRIVDNLLNRSKYEECNRHKQIHNNKKLQGKLSNYHFKLRPVNGRDITTIQKQLEFKKLQKQIDREEKDQKVYSKRRQLDQSKLNVRSKSNFSNAKISAVNLQPVRDNSFNPERLIVEEGKDHLWDAYQAKIWKKQQNLSKNILESILSKRINKGNSIISKINSERSILYE